MMYVRCIGEISRENKQILAKDATRVSISLDTSCSENIAILIWDTVFISRAEVVRADLREISAQHVPFPVDFENT